MSEAHAVAILGLIASSMCCALAVVLYRVGTAGSVARMRALYPPFLAAALQTKLTRPLAGKQMRIGLAGASLGISSVDAEALERDLLAGAAVT